MHDFADFPSDKFLRHLNTTTSIVKAVKTFGTELYKFYHKESFFKNRKYCSQNFQVWWVQAVITPQWLQIAGNSLPNWSSTGCLVSIFTVRINSVFRLYCTFRTRKVPTKIFGIVQRPFTYDNRWRSKWPDYIIRRWDSKRELFNDDIAHT